MKQETKIQNYNNLVEVISLLSASARNNIAKNINQTLIITNWYIGKYIVDFEQKGKSRAEYGKKLLKKLATDLTQKYGKGYSWRNLYYIKRFYLEFPILQTVFAKSDYSKLQTPFTKSQKISDESFSQEEKLLLTSLSLLNWSHFIRLLSIKNKEERNFYIIETAQNRWSERELDRQINSALFERLVLSNENISAKELSLKGQTIQNKLDVLKDPLVLEFLNLKQNSKYSENELETAIIDNIGNFLLELGKGFTFVARQQRISSGTEHFYIDLVFYNRFLNCFVLIDLKIGKLKHQAIGQMLMYVNYYNNMFNLA